MVCLLHIYFGKLPFWFDLFLTSCKKNKDITYIIFTEDNSFSGYKDNIRFYNLGKEAFKKLATQKLGFQIEMSNPYKLCDFKPCFGKIFEDYITEFEYWGCCDNDVIFGNINPVLEQITVSKYDVVSFYKYFMSGPLCLYRNNTEVVNLYSKIENYQHKLLNPLWLALDENLNQDFNTSNDVKRILRKILFGIYNVIFLGFNSRRKFANYWKYKILLLKKSKLKDMTEVVWVERKKGRLKTLYVDGIKSDREFQREGVLSWKVQWEDGILIEKENGRELLCFHFLDSKTSPDFTERLTVNSIDTSIVIRSE